MVLAKPLEDGVEEDIVDEAVREANKVERDAIFRKEVISLSLWFHQSLKTEPFRST